jgi:hypothetical protein
MLHSQVLNCVKQGAAEVAAVKVLLQELLASLAQQLQLLLVLTPGLQLLMPP